MALRSFSKARPGTAGAGQSLLIPNDIRVKILLGPFTTESNVPEGKIHHILGLSYDALALQYEQSGKGPHVHTVKTPMGPEGAIFQPDPNKPSC